MARGCHGLALLALVFWPSACEECEYTLQDYVCPHFRDLGQSDWPATVCVPDSGWHIGDCVLRLPPRGVVIAFRHSAANVPISLVSVQLGRRFEIAGGEAKFVGPSAPVSMPSGQGYSHDLDESEPAAGASQMQKVQATHSGPIKGYSFRHDTEAGRRAASDASVHHSVVQFGDERAGDVWEDHVWVQQNWSSGCTRGIIALSAEVVIADSANVKFERLCASSDEPYDTMGMMGGGAVLARTLEVHGKANFSENHVFGQGGGGAVAAQIVNITGEARFVECSAAFDGGAVYITACPDSKAWEPLRRETGLQYGWEFVDDMHWSGTAAALDDAVSVQLESGFHTLNVASGSFDVFFPRLAFHQGLKPIVAMAWSPTGEHLAAGAVDALYVFRSNMLLVGQAEVHLRTLVWRPDGEAIAGGELCEIWVADLPTSTSSGSAGSQIAGMAVRRAAPAKCSDERGSDRQLSVTWCWAGGLVTVINGMAELWVDDGQNLILESLLTESDPGLDTLVMRSFWRALQGSMLYMATSSVSFSVDGAWLAVVLSTQKRISLYGWNRALKKYLDARRACWLPPDFYIGHMGYPDILHWHPHDDVVLLGCTGCNFFWTIEVTDGDQQIIGPDNCRKNVYQLVSPQRIVTALSWSMPEGNYIVVSTQCNNLACTGARDMLMLFDGIGSYDHPKSRLGYGFFVSGEASFSRTRTLQRGGAVAVAHGSLYLEKATFDNGWAAESGGAVFTEFQVGVLLKHVDFQDFNSCVLGPNHAELRVSLTYPAYHANIQMLDVSLAPMGSLKVRIAMPIADFDINQITGVVCPLGHRRESDYWPIPNAMGKVELLMLRMRCLPCKVKKAFSPESAKCEPCPVGLKCDLPTSDFRNPQFGSFVEAQRTDDVYCENRTWGTEETLWQEYPLGSVGQRHFYWYNDTDNTKVCHQTVCMLRGQELRGDACRSCTELYGEGFTSEVGESCWAKPVEFIQGPAVHAVQTALAEIWMKTSVVANVRCKAWPVRRCGPWRWLLSDALTDTTGDVSAILSACGGLSHTGEALTEDGAAGPTPTHTGAVEIIRIFSQLSHSTVYTSFCEMKAFDKWTNTSRNFTFQTPFSLTYWSAEEPLLFAIIGAVGAMGCMFAASFVHIRNSFRVVLAVGSGAILLAVNLLGFIAAVMLPSGSWDTFGIRLAEALAAGVVACIGQLRSARKQQQEFDEWQLKEALQIAVEVRYPVVLMRADLLMRCGRLPTHEEARSKRLLSFFGAASEVTDFFGSDSSRSFAVFFSHQWTSFASPDPTGKQYEVLCTSLKELCSTTHRRADEIYTWIDIFSIPQACRRTKLLAIQSLPVYASLANAFVIVAPRVVHEDTEAFCDRHSYQRRGWCRIEQLSHRARRGARHMFLADDFGLQALDRTMAPSISDRRESTLSELRSWFDENLYPFSGRAEFTCCRMKHVINGAPVPCDREALMLPMLGLYAEIYRRRSEPQLAGLHAAIAMNLETVFPATFEYVTPQGNQTRDLFRGLVVRLQRHLDAEAVNLVKKIRGNTVDCGSTLDENGWPRSSLCLDLSSVDLYGSAAGCASPGGTAVWMGAPTFHRSGNRLRAGAIGGETGSDVGDELAAVGAGGSAVAEGGGYTAARRRFSSTKNASALFTQASGVLALPVERMEPIHSFPQASASCSDHDEDDLISSTAAGPISGTSSSFVASRAAGSKADSSSNPCSFTSTYDREVVDPETLSAAGSDWTRGGQCWRANTANDSRDSTLELVRVEITARSSPALLPGPSPGRRDQS